MTNQGLVLDTFQLQDILAEGSYLQDLGRPEAARVLKDAAIAEARARQVAEQERLLAEEAIAEANRNLALKQAGIQAEIDAAKAKSAAAGPLAQAERDQAILTEQEKVAVRTAALTERQLDTQVRRPADAERYRVEQEAEGRKNSAILTAEAQRQATIAAAQAAAEQHRQQVEAERDRVLAERAQQAQDEIERARAEITAAADERVTAAEGRARTAEQAADTARRGVDERHIARLDRIGGVDQVVRRHALQHRGSRDFDRQLRRNGHGVLGRNIHLARMTARRIGPRHGVADAEIRHRRANSHNGSRTLGAQHERW
jgi:flotillin